MAPLAVQICCSAVRWTPVVFITAIVLWSYYAYVVQMCIYAVENPAEKVIYLLLYHPLIVMFMWSYAKTIFTQVGTVPKQNAVSILRPLYVSTEHEHLYQDGVDSIVVGWSVFLRLKVMQQLHKQCSMKSIKCLFRGNDPQFYLPKQEADRLERETNEEVQKTILVNFARNSNLPVQNRTHSGAPRYCEKCHCIKPDRCHHCSVCGVCVLKMDHHCPWVNNCVGFTTYKFFVMFLGYALLYCIYVALTSLKYFIQFWSSGLSNNMGRFHVLFLFFVAVMFAISLISLFGYHCYLTAHNRSTLESFRSPIFQSGPDKNGFSLGKRNNFIEIFGENRKLWFIPVFTSEGDGVTFPTRTPSASSSYQTMGNTTPTVSSAGDGVTFPTRTVDLDSDGLLADRQRWMEEGELEQMGNGYGSNYSRHMNGVYGM